jgi:hypothetical protein
LKGIDFLDIKYDKKKNQMQLKLPQLRCIQFNSVELPFKARIKCKFLLKGSKLLKKGTHYFGIRQLFEGFEVGRITWALKPKIQKRK